MTPGTNEPSTVTGIGENIRQILPRIRPPSEALQAAQDERERLAGSRAASARRNALAAHLGRRYWPDAVALEAFERYHKNQPHALGRLVAFMADLPARVEAGEGLVLFGDVGTGKDRLMACALYAACESFKVEYRSGQDLFGSFRDRMDAGGREEQMLRDLAAPDVLALSDPAPPAGELSSWRLEILYRIVDRRYRDRRPTWLTVNATSAAEAEAKLGSQVWDRLQEGAAVIACQWPSYRERRRP